MNTQCAISCAKFLGKKARRLPTPVKAKGYNGVPGKEVTHFILFDLLIDNKRLHQIPFLILDLGNHDMILGSKWMAYFDVMSDLRRRKLIWHNPPPRYESFAKVITTRLRDLERKIVNPRDQVDVYRRERAFDKEDQQRQAQQQTPVLATIGTTSKSDSRLPSYPTHAQNIKYGLIRMNRELLADTTPVRPLPKQDRLRNLRKELTSQPREETDLNIAEISPVAFNLNLKRPTNTLFSISLHEIEQELTRLTAAEDTIDFRTLIYEKLPKVYWEYEDVFSKAASDQLPPHRSIDHVITLEDNQTINHGPLYSQSITELEAIKKYLLENLDKGFIEPSQAPFSSPVLFVKKSDGSLRFCVDFRKLNAITRKDRYPLPLIDETLARLNKAMIFTKLDIRQAFHRIRMHPNSEELTTFRTRYGSYKCKVLPFGLTNGPATYQRYMNDILFDYLDVFCTAYLDDILIYSENEEDHAEHVIKVLTRLREAGLQADIKKCEFGVTRTKYLGFIVTTKGIEVDPEKVEVIHGWQPPKSVRGVQSFLGFCNFYRRFIEDYGRVAKPLIHLTKNDITFDFNEDCLEAFAELKRRLTSAPVLAHYNPTLPSRLETDASDGVIAAVFSQKGTDGSWHPVAFFSKTMIPAELNYQIHDKEMLAIIRSLSHWRAELQGSEHRLEILTDHKALEYFMTTKKLNSRQARWGEMLADFYFQIGFRPGKSNERADALSRRDQDMEPQNMVKEAIRHRSLLDSSQIQLMPALEYLNLFFMDSFQLIEAIVQHNRTDPAMEPLRDLARKETKGYTLEDGLLYRRERLVVSEADNLRTRLIQEAHDQISSAHPGTRKTQHILSEKYYWKGLKGYVERYVGNCTKCRQAHAPRDKTPGLLHPLPIPDHPWQHISVDFKNQPKDKDGYDNVCVFIDRMSKAAISIPCHRTATAKDMAEMYYVHAYRYYDLPDSIVSDRGPQFISDFWNAFCAILGVKVKLSTAYSPQTDGQTEIMNQYLDQRLRPFVNHYQDNWSRMLPALDNAQLTLPHDSIGMSPFQLSRGYSPRKSFDWKAPKAPETAREKLAYQEAVLFAKQLEDGWKVAREILQRSQDKMTAEANKHRREPDFDIGDWVWLSSKNYNIDRPSRKLGPKVIGSYRILDRVGYSYKLDLPPTMKIWPVIHARYLRKDPRNPLNGQIQDPLPSVNISGEDEWDVEEVRSVRKHYEKMQYRINWLGADEDPTYYKASNVKYAPHLLRDFHIQNPHLPGPPRHLPEWIKAWEQGVDEYDDLDDDREMTAGEKRKFLKRYQA